MIKLFRCELRTLKKDIILYCIVLIFIYSMITCLISFAKSALTDADNVIKENTQGISYSIKVTNPDEELASYFNDYDFHNISCCFINENRIFTNPLINGKAVAESFMGDSVVFNLPEDSKRFTMSINDIKNDCVFLSESTAHKLNMSVGDEILFQIQNGNIQSKCIIGGFYEPTENAHDFLITPECERRILKENSLSEKYYALMHVDTYDECGSVINKFSKKGYKATSTLYTFIYKEVNNIYVMCNGIISMSIVLCVGLVVIFVSFFNVIFIKRDRFISLLIRQGMSKKRIIQLYWMIIKSIHIIISIISIPIISNITKWISSEYFKAFDIANESISFNSTDIITVFFAVALIIAISMIFFQKKLNMLYYKTNDMKGSRK